MSAYKTQQIRLVHRGQSFHFVSYEGRPANPKFQQSEMPATWYLMLAGKRWMVCPVADETTPEEMDRRFGEWLDAHVFDAAPAVQSEQPPSPGSATRAGAAEALRSAIPPAGASGRGPFAR
jgi:hypothetical protein